MITMSEGNVVEVDLTDIQYIDQTSRIKLNMTGASFEFKPISAAIYYDYLSYEPDKELDARKELLLKCLIDSSVNFDELGDETISIVNLLFEYLFNYSFLKKVN